MPELQISGLELISEPGNFYDQWKELSPKGYKLITSEQVARLVIDNVDHPLLRQGLYVRETYIFNTDDMMYLVRDFEHADKRMQHEHIRAIGATITHRMRKAFVQPQHIVPYVRMASEDANKEPEEQRVLAYRAEKSRPIPTNSFADEDIARFIFRYDAYSCGQALLERGIKQIGSRHMPSEKYAQPEIRLARFKPFLPEHHNVAVERPDFTCAVVWAKEQ